MNPGLSSVRATPGQAPDGRPRPVLYVVDDDDATLALLHDVAEEAGWEAIGFARLDSLRSAINRRRPDLVILDDELPDGRGGDLARKLRRNPALTGVPMLVCTAAHPLRRAEIGGWTPVVAKPFDLDEIERFLASAATERRDGHARRRVAG